MALPPHQPTPQDDLALLVTLAESLEVSEHAVFARAHECWFGRTAPERLIDRYFSRYLTAGEVPFWVRHYCRRHAQAPATPRSLAGNPTRPSVARCAAVASYLLLCLTLACGVFYLY